MALVLARVLVLTTDFMSCGDCPRYIDIAESPFVFTASPWGYRIFVPYLARAIADLTPLDLDQSFLLLTGLAIGLLAATLVSWLVVSLRRSLLTAHLVLILYLSSFGAVVYLHGYQNIGFWDHLVVLLGMIAIYHRRWVWLIPLLAMGQLVKESAVILIPMYGLFEVVSRGRTAPVRTIVRNLGVLSAVYVAVFFFLRSGVLWRTGGNAQDYVSYYTPQYFEWLFSVYGGPLRAIPKTLAITAVTLPLALVGLRHSGRRDRAIATMAVLAWSQLLFGGDVERLMLMAYLGLAIPIATLLDDIALPEKLGLTALGVAAFYIHYYLAFSPRFYDPITWTNDYLWMTRPLTAASWMLVLGWYFGVFHPRTRNRPRSSLRGPTRAAPFSALTSDV